MNNIIEFKSKDFRFGSRNQFGGRMMVTVGGRNSEIYELECAGRPDGAWIYVQKSLEPETDYTFRFEVTCNGAPDKDSDIRCAVFPAADPGDKTVFPLGQSRFAPAISKKAADGGLVRVFEIPFSTREAGEGEERIVYQINLFVKGCNAIFNAPLGGDGYSSLEDCTYAEWREEIEAKQNAEKEKLREEQKQRVIDEAASRDQLKTSFLQRKLGISYDEAKELIELALETRKKFAGAPASEEPEDDEDEDKDEDYEDDEDDEDEDDEDEEEVEFDVEIGNAHWTEKEFAEKLRELEECQNALFGNIFVERAHKSACVDIGCAVYDSRIDVGNGYLCTGAYKLLISKMGDGCSLSFNNCIESYDGSEPVVIDAGFDGTTVNFRNGDITNVTFANLLSAVGDGCWINLINTKIRRVGEVVDGQVKVGRLLPEDVDGLCLNFENAKIPAEIMNELRKEIEGTSNTLNPENCYEY
ncbi:MAG: hypothetical protein J5760_07175 [Clostridia bacterium]|nr:hypothetical protein [Clostridia bacterium]